METRVYAIKETEDIHEISNDDFMNQAEELGNVWSLSGFQNEINCEGSPSLSISDFKDLHFRFIDVPTEKNELSDLEWLRKFASYVSDRWNDAYNDASKFADSNNDDVYTLQCDEADTDGLKNKCFCDDCGEYVETSECTMNDYTENVDGIEVDVSEVLCNTCNENKDKTPSMDKIYNSLDKADVIHSDVCKLQGSQLAKKDEPKQIGINKCCTKGNMVFDDMPVGMELETYHCSECETDYDVQMDVERHWDDMEERK